MPKTGLAVLMHQDPALYRKAYARYLRRGTPLDISLKAADHPTPYYVWRTRGDDKVRTAHAENNGKIFAWDNPPPTGNPGEDYGCRCMAEPYYGIPNDQPIEPVYPIETLIGLFAGGGFLRGIAFNLFRQITDIDAKTLSLSQFENLKRFGKKLPKDARDIQILRGQDGQRIFRADVPAKNIPGSFARYEKIVDKLGNTISYSKTTYAPDGHIIHVKIK